MFHRERVLMEKKLVELISVAKGEIPADLILANGRVINVFSGEIEQANVAIYGKQDSRGRRLSAGKKGH